MQIRITSFDKSILLNVIILAINSFFYIITFINLLKNIINFNNFL